MDDFDRLHTLQRTLRLSPGAPKKKKQEKSVKYGASEKADVKKTEKPQRKITTIKKKKEKPQEKPARPLRIFITGTPGSGKSTLLAEVKEFLQKQEKNVAGILTPEIRAAGAKKRKGFWIEDIASGKRELMASPDFNTGFRVSRYKVNVDAIDRIVACCAKSFPDADYVLIDEIGRMELFSDHFRNMLEKIFAGGKPIIAALHAMYADEYKERGTVLFLTKERYGEIKREALKIVGGQ